MKRGWIAAVLLALTACSGGSGGSDGTAAGDKAALEKAYRDYIAAFLDGDGETAYALLSQRCQDKETLAEFTDIAQSAATIYGQVDYTIDSVTVNGDHGTVDATYAVEALNSSGGSTWLLEDGEWRSDKCG